MNQTKPNNEMLKYYGEFSRMNVLVVILQKEPYNLKELEKLGGKRGVGKECLGCCYNTLTKNLLF